VPAVSWYPIPVYEEADEGCHGKKGERAPSLSELPGLTEQLSAEPGKAKQQCYYEIKGYPCHMQG